MGLFGFGNRPNIDDGVKEWKETKGAVLIDVRTENEFDCGHVAGSINVPLDQLTVGIGTVAKENTPIFTYCLSGARSAQAVDLLKQLGYKNVKNIGGINKYHGKFEVDTDPHAGIGRWFRNYS